MEITEKQKQIIGIGIGVGVVGLITAVGYFYYRKPKDELGYDEIEQIRLPKLKSPSRWRDIEAKYEELDGLDNRNKRRNRFTVYNKDDRPRVSRLRNAEVNMEFPDDYNNVSDRFKIMKTHTQEKRQTTGRLRTSGDRGAYNNKSHSYNRNNRNETLKDLIIP